MNYFALASDYDGTLARDGHVSRSTLAAIDRLRATNRKLILVTGRELAELRRVFPAVMACDAVVAENGGIIYWPREDREEILGDTMPEAFIAEINRREVKPYSVGRVIFATWRPHEVAVLETIQSLGLGHQIIFNKRAVMVLPSGITKATGLLRVLEHLELKASQTVGIGDAENDHAFLDQCGIAVAVANALPSLKEHCDLVTAGDHGRGVEEVIGQLIADDMQSLGPRRPRQRMIEREIKSPPE